MKSDSQKSRHRLRHRVFTHYSGGTPRCACCGEKRLEFLSIDHVGGGGAAHRKLTGGGGQRTYEWLRRNNFPPGFRVLCHNCNQAIGFYGYCPHQVERGETVGSVAPEKTCQEKNLDAVLDAGHAIMRAGCYPSLYRVCRVLGLTKGSGFNIANRRKVLIAAGKWPSPVRNSRSLEQRDFIVRNGRVFGFSTNVSHGA